MPFFQSTGDSNLSVSDLSKQGGLNPLIRAPVKTVVANSNGKFDFGLLKPGHCYLKIHDQKGSLSAVFQIELKGGQNPKESEIIDISPVHPDCTGGHEFILKGNQVLGSS